MKLIKKLIDWFENLLWRQAIKDVFESPEYYFNNGYKDGDTECHDTKLQEHIKQRILETAFNNGGIYGEVAEDIADRIDIWVDEFRRNKNA